MKRADAAPTVPHAGTALPPPAAPVAALQAVFADIADTRMRGLPILNPALQVETVGFREWQGRWLGVLVTPWTINLVLLAGAGAAVPPLQLGAEQVWQFPSGAYAFMGFHDDRLGGCQVCPLISPVGDITSQEQARALASEVMGALFAAASGPAAAAAPVAAAPAVGATACAAPAARAGAAPPFDRAGNAEGVSLTADRRNRRAFLRAVLPGA